MYFVSQETAVEMELDKLISRYRKRRLVAQKERKEYYCDHGHNWIINMCKDVEKDLKELKTVIQNKKSCECQIINGDKIQGNNCAWFHGFQHKEGKDD